MEVTAEKSRSATLWDLQAYGPIIVYTRLPAGVTYYTICTFPASSECFIGISDAFSAFCLRVSVIFPTCSLYPQQLERVPTLRYTCRHAPTGRFSKAGLQEWMCFVIFRAESRSALLGRFLSRRCFTLCITVEAEPRPAKQYKCHHCCSCKNYRGKGMEGGKKVSLHQFLADQKIVSSLASYSTSNKLLLIARHILTTGLQKCL